MRVEVAAPTIQVRLPNAKGDVPRPAGAVEGDRAPGHSNPLGAGHVRVEHQEDALAAPEEDVPGRHPLERREADDVPVESLPCREVRTIHDGLEHSLGLHGGELAADGGPG